MSCEHQSRTLGRDAVQSGRGMPQAFFGPAHWGSASRTPVGRAAEHNTVYGRISSTSGNCGRRMRGPQLSKMPLSSKEHSIVLLSVKGAAGLLLTFKLLILLHVT
jgi:hypothetical protein